MAATPGTEFPFVIKVCGITSADDAQVALDAGANALGFNFYARSPRYVSISQARDIADRVTGSYLRVGVFVNARAEELLDAAAAVPLDVLQLHGECEIPEPCAYALWRAIPGGSSVVQHDARVEAYLLDAVTEKFGGSGQTFNWSSAARFPHRAIVAGGLDPDNVGRAIAALRPWGVDACSRLESAPGKKDAARVVAFIHEARKAASTFAGIEFRGSGDSPRAPETGRSGLALGQPPESMEVL